MVSGSVTVSKYSWEKSCGGKSLRTQESKNYAGKPSIHCSVPSTPSSIEEIEIDSAFKELR